MVFALVLKIAALLVIVAFGFSMVKYGLLRSEESRVLSVLSIYLMMPCVVLVSFQVDISPTVQQGLILSLIAGVIGNVLLIAINQLIKKSLNLNPVEQTSIVYSNSVNLLIPLIVALLGNEWVIYTSGFFVVQTVFLWSHGKSVLCGDGRPNILKLLTNVNMVAIFAGIILYVSGIRLPSFVNDAMALVGNMIGPAAMLVTGMLIGSMKLDSILRYRRRLPGIVFLRLIGTVLPVLIIFKFSSLMAYCDIGQEVLLISLLAAAAPSASSVTQMAQVYGQDAKYASAINVTTTLGCIITMPLMVYLYML